MSKENREYRDVIQKLVGRQGSASRGSPDEQRRQQRRQTMKQLRQHVYEVRHETGEAVSHIHEGMLKMEARFSQSEDSSHHGNSKPSGGGAIAAGLGIAGSAAYAGAAPADRFQSDTLRAMQELILKRRASEIEEDGTTEGAGNSSTAAGEPGTSSEQSTSTA